MSDNIVQQTEPTEVGRLSSADRVLLRKVFRWAHRNGWMGWANLDGASVELTTVFYRSRPVKVLGVTRPRDPRFPNPAITVWPRSVVEAIDVLCAVGILPCEFSSAHRAGFEAGIAAEQRQGNGLSQLGGWPA